MLKALRKAAQAAQEAAAAQQQQESAANPNNYNAGTRAIGNRSTEQTAVIFDALSEGPIEGLVDGPASVRLNKNPVMGNTAYSTFSPQRTLDAGYTASTKTIVDNVNPDVFTNMSTDNGDRYALIVGGSKRGTKCSTQAGNVIVTSTDTSDIAFASTDVMTDTNMRLAPQIRIAKAGPNGTDHVAKIVRYINTAAVEVNHAPMTTVTNSTVKIDLVDKIASYDSSNNKCILTNGGGIDTANAIVQVSSPSRNPNSLPTYNYNNFGLVFRTGEQEQRYVSVPYGTGSASKAHNINANLDQVQGGTSYSGHPTCAQFAARTSRWKNPPSGNDSASASIYTSDAMSIGNPSEVDIIKVNLGFNSLISQKDEGDLGHGFAEFRIKFGFSRDGGSSYTDVTVLGRDNITNDINQYHANSRYKGYSSGIITGKTKQPFVHTFEFPTTAFQPYDKYRVSVERISVVNQDENHWSQQNASQIKSIENIITDKLTYPYTAFAGVIVDAEDFSQIPTRDYEVYGMKVKVPTNYFPRDERSGTTNARRTVAAYTRNVETGADTGAYVDWDGNFRGDRKTFSTPGTNSVHAENYDPVYCNNPAWIFFDLLTNHRYGLGQFIDPDGDFAQIDKYQLYQVAKYCDELVPDGEGGTEPRFTCNTYLSKPQDAYKAIQQFAQVMRSMLLWHGGQVTLGQNAQKGPVYLFNKSNVLGGEFSYSGTALRNRHNQIRVTWNDPEDSYKQAVEVVEDESDILKTNKVRSKDAIAYGCTSKGQAIRFGKWILYSEGLEQEMCTFATGIQGAALRPGDVIDVQDSDEREVLYSGRVTNAATSTTTQIKVDRDLTSYINGTDNFYLSLIYPEGGAYLMEETATINSVVYNKGDYVPEDETGADIDSSAKARNCKDDAGAIVHLYWSEDLRVETQAVSAYNVSTVTVSSAFTGAPTGDTMFSLVGEKADGSNTVGSAKQYIITSIKEENDKMTYSITAAAYDLVKFDMVDRGYELPQFPEELRPPKRTTNVPAPTNLTAEIVPSNEASQGLENDQTASIGYDVLVSWQHPASLRADSDGTALADVYEHLAGYNIQHNVDSTGETRPGSWTTEYLAGNTHTSYRISDVKQGDEFKVRVQTVRTDNKTSDYIQVTAKFPTNLFPTFTGGLIGGGLNGGIMKGGILTTAPVINASTGTVTFANSTYSFQPLGAADPIAVSAGNTNFTTCSGFNNLADGEEGYLLYDYDANLARGSTRTDPLHAIHLHTDTTATNGLTGDKYRFKFFKRLGEASNDLVAANGTVTMTSGAPKVTGSSTTFKLDFQEGDVVTIDAAGTDRFMSTVSNITSNTVMQLVSAPNRAYSGKNIYRQALRLDSSKDSIIAMVANNSGTFAITPFTNKQVIDNSSEVAANVISGTQIAANSITAASIVAGSIGSSLIAANSIGTAAIAAGAITDSLIAANTITNASIAANTINSTQLSTNAIDSFSVSANEITAVEIASNAIGAAQVAANSIASAEISANSIGSSEILANAVNGTIIAGNSVGGTQISANSVNGIIIAGGAVDTTQLATDAVEAAKIATGAVGSDAIAANAIGSSEIATNSVSAINIVAGQIDSSHIGANSIGSTAIVANAIGQSEIGANSITAAAVVAGTITNSEIAGNTINSAVIQAGAVTAPQIAANSITSAKIAAGNVDTAEIAADAITSAKIAANAIDSAEIKSGSIDAVHIGADQITNAKIAANAIGTTEIAANNITAASISSTSSLNLTISAGSAGGWVMDSTVLRTSDSKIILDSTNKRIVIAD